MDVLILLVFVSLTLAASAVGFFAWLVRQRTFQHADRLALLAIEEDARPGATTKSARRASKVE
ncbi:hypothetical protein [Sandaracinus amylolyticus]|uniref:Cbb3-type cytochrome oxidase assembly protein CcoS n=1 Tax=Sandaracinus amylolyticus TaxID=927083 RepID=A0A0F6W5G3_9BACT|nr:hypothetical protein [Sandaracinus amylolyticus]AKF07937.1 hypothetical protein DB32_005086 [Sandaracinus amylolyticus]